MITSDGWREINDALNRHLADAVEQIGVGMTHRPRRPDLSMLAVENARRSLAAFVEVYAAALEDDCPGSWRLPIEKRREILGHLLT